MLQYELHILYIIKLSYIILTDLLINQKDGLSA